ncbi:hypothetical protein HanXRQr2_Chr07g0283231 [Helianthus annuus]|uniref:Uncharacterized protein n=1 Tax=Helianthus annuus TaxID=4232 RepID=A0A9K3IJ34_HELAN|nr:hypothetical protein HanXRQr2_Chr07g0283231 [Helianthus annuus]KAJ0903792.1 hypothetical protein HanPSC8_Chr07g0274081 [Helianthus annuus]
MHVFRFCCFPTDMADPPRPVRKFHRHHNQIALINENVRGGAEYSDIMRFLRNSIICFTISENIHQVQEYIEDFWRTAQIVDNSIEATIHGSPIVITEAVIRAALRFGDLDYGNTCYVKQIRERGARSFGYVGCFTKKEIAKGLILGQWRYFFHVMMQCLAPRKSGMDGMAHDLLSAMIGLTYNQPYYFSLMIFQAFKHHIGLKENDKRLMILYPRFLLHSTLVAKSSTDVRPVTTPLLGAIVQENYNPENDPVWLNIRNGVAQIFSGEMQAVEANVHEPVVVQPLVNLQQPPVNIPEPDPIEELVIDEPIIDASVQENVFVHTPVSTSSATGVAVETDEVILELDAALEAGPSSRAVDKGKQPIEEVFVDESVNDMLTEKQYLLLVMKNLQNRITPSERERLDLFCAKVASFGPSSDWNIRLASWSDRVNDLDSIAFSSSSSDDEDEDYCRPDTDTVRVSAPLKTYKRRRVTVSDF